MWKSNLAPLTEWSSFYWAVVQHRPRALFFILNKKLITLKMYHQFLISLDKQQCDVWRSFVCEGILMSLDPDLLCKIPWTKPWKYFRLFTVLILYKCKCTNMYGKKYSSNNNVYSFDAILSVYISNQI